MKCIFCKGTMELSKVSYTVDRQGYHLFIKDIPAYVCSQCGEQYFEEQETMSIQNLLKSFEQQLKKIRYSTLGLTKRTLGKQNI